MKIIIYQGAFLVAQFNFFIGSEPGTFPVGKIGQKKKQSEGVRFC